MDRAYLLYCRIGAVVFAINTIYPVTTKFLQERLADDWLHSVLHLCSALFGIYAGWYASNSTPAAPPRSQAPSISSVRKRSPGGWGFRSHACSLTSPSPASPCASSSTSLNM